MITIKDFKIFLKALINSSRYKSGKSSGVTVNSIKKDLQYHENIDVDEFVKENGRQNLLDLIKEWEDFSINHNTTEPTIRVKCEDHISQMNKQLKRKSGSINAIAKEINTAQRLKIVLGPDPYDYTSDSSINVFSGQSIPVYQFNDDISILSSDSDSSDIKYLTNRTITSNSKKINIETKENQGTQSNEHKELPNKKANQILTQLNVSRPLPVMQTPPSNNSVTNARQKPKQKLNIPNNVKVSFKIVKTIDQLIPACKVLDVNIDNIVFIAMLDVVNPHRFWFAEYNEYKALDEVMKNMQEFYVANHDSLRINTRDIKRGLYIAAIFDGIWHRGMIIKHDQNFARISYVDFGTADDVALIDLCYLKQDFLYLPSIARRGVLAYIQPKENEEWSVESTNFFESCIKDKKLEIKIFKYNSHDNSYCLGIKYKNEQKTLELLTQSMISNNFARIDLKFLDDEIISKDSYAFQDYEDGILLDIKTPTKVDAFASWIPSDSWIPNDSPVEPVQVTKKASASKSLPTPSTSGFNTRQSVNKALTTPTKTDPPVNTSFPKAGVEVKRNLANAFINAANHNENQVIHQKSNQTIVQANQSPFQANLTNTSTPKQSVKSCPSIVKKQSFEKFNVGQDINIFIHVFYNPCCFFFYIKEEMAETKKFLDYVNEACKGNIECLTNEEFVINREVAIFHNKNYCRGRINSIIENLYQIFLIDFGIFTMKTHEEIYKLPKQLSKRQCCVYKGFTQDAFKYEGAEKTFIAAKILGIRSENTIDLKLEALNN